MRAYINSQWYNIDDGATITTNFNETLDSATIRISQQTSIIDIQPFDEVIIEYTESNTTHTRYFCVDSFNETRKSFDADEDVLYYTYDIELFSQTKLLENVILPNISITPRKLSTPLTIIQFINRIMIQYCPKYWIGSSYTQKYTIASSVTYDARFNQMCPELQWTTPTLREVLNDLFMLCDCIPTLNNGVISALDLSQNSGYTIQNSDFNYVQRTQSSNDYASELRMNLQNVMQSDVVDVRNTITTYEALTFTTENYVVNQNNYYLKTKFPILRIKHLWCNVYTTHTVVNPDDQSTTTKFYTFRADLCNLKLSGDVQYYSLVKEKSEYDILPVTKYQDVEHVTNLSDFANNKNNNCFYTRGSNIISGFSSTQKIDIFGFTQSALARMLCVLGKDITNTMTGTVPYRAADHNDGYFYPTFEIEYETSMGCIFAASKSKKMRNERTIMDNQTNAWVDITAQSNLEYQKANRISNLSYLLNGRKLLSERFVDIGDVYDDDKIVYSVTWQLNQNSCTYNAYLTESYILKDYFTGIDSKIRTWVNAQEEAFIRHDLQKFYIIASQTQENYSDYEEYDWYSQYTPKGVVYFSYKYVLSSLLKTTQVTAKPFKRAVIQTKLGANTYYPDSTNGFNVELSTRLAQKSILVTTGFDDNVIALKCANAFGTHSSGDSTKDDGIIATSDIDPISLVNSNPPYYTFPEIDVGGDIGGIPLTVKSYTSKEGAFDEIIINLCASNTPDIHVESFTEMNVGTDDVNFYYNRMHNQLNSLSSDSLFKIKNNLYKDNKEIIQQTIQFEFLSDDEGIILTDDFIRMHSMVYTGTYVDTFTYTCIDGDGNEHNMPNASHIISNINEVSIILDVPTGVTAKWYCIYRDGRLLVKTKYFNFFINLQSER